jgi:cobalt-zinc-cadmium efflux system membrane fusion protein
VSRVRLAPAILIALLSLAACKGKSEPQPKANATKEPGVDVELTPEALAAAHLGTIKVEAASRGSTVTAAGTIEFVPNKVARVGPIVDGRILGIRVQHGDVVKAGTLLATMDSPPVGRARADYVGAVSRLMLAERELEREKKLVGEGATSQREVERAETARSLAEFEVRAAGERLKSFGIDPKPLGNLDAGAYMASTATTLHTPIGGTVMQVDARVGQSVRAADTLFVVGSVDPLWLVVYVYERDLGRVREGDPVKVDVLARPGRTFTGRVDHVHNVIDPDKRAADVRIVLANGDGQLGPGMSASARIQVMDNSADGGADKSTVVMIPRNAIQGIDGQPFVFVQHGAPGRYELRAIERGKDYDGLVEVVRGLNAGETIVTDGSFILKSEVLREQMGKND